VLGILSDAVAAIDAGRAPDGIVCAGLATSLGASAAVVVEVRAQGGSAVSYGWPDAAAASDLAAYVTHAARVPTSDVATIEVHRIGGGEWSVLLCRVRPAGAARTHDGVRVVAFTRDVPFTPEDVELWESARRPLSVLWRHVEEERARPVLVSTPVLRSESPEEHAMSRRERQVLATPPRECWHKPSHTGSRALGGPVGAQHLLRFTLTSPEGKLIGGYSIVVGAAAKVG